MLEVLKRNGSTEGWDKRKMVSSMINAGLPEVQAGLITALIKENIIESGKQTVHSSKLRNMIIGVLKAVGSNATGVYKYFSKNVSD